jgi:hypothetical protein
MSRGAAERGSRGEMKQRSFSGPLLLDTLLLGVGMR